MSDDVIAKIIERFESKIDAIVTKVTEVEIKMATLTAQKEGQERICEIHGMQMAELKTVQEEHKEDIDDHETRITTLETSKSNNKEWIVILVAVVAALAAVGSLIAVLHH